MIFRSTVDMAASCSGLARLERGIIASEGSSVTLSISATLRSPVSRLSSTNASTMPSTAPSSP